MICGQGPTPAAATTAALPPTAASTLVPGSGLLRGRRAGRLRRVAAAPARPRHAATSRAVLAPAIGYAEDGFPRCRQAARRSRWSRPLFERSGPRRPRSTCRTGGRRAGSPAAQPRRWPRPTGASSPRPKPPPAARENRIDAAAQCLVPRVRRRGDRPASTHGRRHHGRRNARPAHRPRPGGLAAHVRAAAAPPTTAATPCSKARPLVAGPGVPAAARACSRASTWRRWTSARRRATSTRVVECAKLAFADREAFYGDPRSPTSRCAGCSRPEYAAARRELVGEPRAASCVQARTAAARRALPAPADRTRRGQRGAIGDPGGGEADRGRATPCYIDVVDRDGNMVVADPERRLAAELPGDPGARLPARHARADGLARRGPPERARAGQAAADHPDADAGAARRRALTSRSARPGGDQQDQWTLKFFLAPRRLRARPAGGDRRAGVPHRALAQSSFYPRASMPNVDARGGTARRADDRTAAGSRPRRPRRRRLVAGPRQRSRDRARRHCCVAAANPRGMQGYAAGR